jgi:cold shock protein
MRPSIAVAGSVTGDDARALARQFPIQTTQRRRRTQMPQGTVKMFKTDKGFGFIAPDGGGADVYVNVSELEKTGISILYLGQKVTFDVERDSGTGKPRALNVQII